MQPSTDVGCFGSAVSFDPAGRVCQACPHYVSCQEKSVETTTRLSERLNVRSLIQKQKRFYKGVIENRNGVTQTRLATGWQVNDRPLSPWAEDLPERAKRMVRRAEETGDTIPSMLRRGSNPFRQTGPAYMAAMCEEVIEGTLYRQDVIRRLIEEGRCSSEGSARALVSAGLSLLMATGEVERKGDHYKRIKK